MKPYTPRADSLASQVIGFFINNPQEELMLVDITDKFSAKRGNIPTLLGDAVTAGMLVREKDVDGDYVYKAGPKCPQRLAGLDMDAVHTRQRHVAPAKAEIDLPATPQEVVIDEGIPLPTRAGRVRLFDWNALLKRMKPGQSCKLPLNVRHTLANAITAIHKDGTGRQFSVRNNKPEKELRLWRVT